MSTPEDPPYSSTALLASTLAPVSTGVFVHKHKHQIITDSENEVFNSTYVHDTDLDTSTEIARERVSMEEDATSAKLTLGVLHTNTSSLQQIQSVVCTDASQTVISSTDGSSSCNLTLDGSISWDTDDASLYLSTDKSFRIRFVESDGIVPSRLVIEGYSTVESDYLPKAEFYAD